MLICSCNGLTATKLSDSDFVDLLQCNDIVALSESWTDKRTLMQICVTSLALISTINSDIEMLNLIAEEVAFH